MANVLMYALMAIMLMVLVWNVSNVWGSVRDVRVGVDVRNVLIRGIVCLTVRMLRVGLDSIK